jgi:hypothetical protein
LGEAFQQIPCGVARIARMKLGAQRAASVPDTGEAFDHR